MLTPHPQPRNNMNSYKTKAYNEREFFGIWFGGDLLQCPFGG